MVAHRMSALSIQVGLGRYVALSHPATLGVIAGTSHEMLTETWRLLSILRSEAHEDDGGDEGDCPVMPGLTSRTSWWNACTRPGRRSRWTWRAGPGGCPRAWTCARTASCRGR
ncbi:hypothetical protein HS048_35125 [Planomonospora sp. ID91781]|nr:hypothetical protein [Planomonospora sp. ID91781]